MRPFRSGPRARTTVISARWGLSTPHRWALRHLARLSQTRGESLSDGGFDNVPVGNSISSGVGGAEPVDAECAMGLTPTDTTDSSFNLPPVVTSLPFATSSSAPDSGLSPGEIAGIVIGSFLGVALALGLAMWRQRVKAHYARARSEWMRRLEMSLRRGREKDVVDEPETKEDKLAV